MLNYYDRGRDPGAFAVPVVQTGTLSALRGHKYAVLVTFRRNGEPVPSPIWFGMDGGKAYIRTGADSWKVKRIRKNPSVVIAPSNRKGKPLGPGIAAVARILPPEEHPRAIAARLAAYGLGRWIYDRSIAKVYGEATYLEVMAVHAEQPSTETRSRS
ncbi:MAG TPA: PPOX class F420-dependent oxidoreductase [Micromonosporaceae bacterium]|nr:PPOX class F420-dependent oxidoreductase [Micromonosporaceae bacterium]